MTNTNKNRHAAVGTTKNRALEAESPEFALDVRGRSG